MWYSVGFYSGINHEFNQRNSIKFPFNLIMEILSFPHRNHIRQRNLFKAIRFAGWFLSIGAGCRDNADQIGKTEIGCGTRSGRFNFILSAFCVYIWFPFPLQINALNELNLLRASFLFIISCSYVPMKCCNSLNKFRLIETRTRIFNSKLDLFFSFSYSRSVWKQQE